MRSPAQRPGHALVGTMIFLVLGMLLWAAMHQRSAGQLRAEKALRVGVEQSDGIKRPMAWALALMETDKPPGGRDGYICRMIVDGQTYLVVFDRLLKEPPTYQVTVTLKDPSYDEYPLAPDTF